MKVHCLPNFNAINYLQLVTKGVKISLFLVLFATIGINVFFIVETTKKLSLQTTADYPTGSDNIADELPTLNEQKDGQQGRPMKDYNHRRGSEYNAPNQKDHIEENQLRADNTDGNDVQPSQLNINAPQRSNQLKLQELSKPKSISIEVLSSKSKVSVNIDGTTVSNE